MKIEPFKVEEWMNTWEEDARWNIAETCCDSLSPDELFALTGEDREKFFDDFCGRRLTYGKIRGREDLRQSICRLYKTIHPDEIVLTHGASGANHHIFYTLLSPGDRVICIVPTYQQLYSIPESYGADVVYLHLEKKNGYLPDLEQLRRLATPDTKMICINNPNNPIGSLMSGAMLREIADIAGSVDAWVLCDEVYRHLTQEDTWSESIADLYDKGISVSSMSKVFSLAGLRLGWICTHDRKVIRDCFSHRDYNLISCGMFDEAVAALALKHVDRILDRNRTLVRRNLRILNDWVKSEPLMHYKKPEAGTTALVHYDLKIPSYQFCEEMYHLNGTFVTPGDCFGEPQSMRIGYACDTEVLKKGLAGISEYMKGRM